MPPKSNNRKRNYDRVCVRLDETEARQVKQNAENTGLSKAGLMRTLATGHIPKSIIDSKHICALIHLRGDVGRMRGLLKFWLSEDGKIINYNPHEILSIARNADSTQRQIGLVIDKLSPLRFTL